MQLLSLQVASVVKIESQALSQVNSQCLLEQIDSFKSPQCSIDNPFRLCVPDVFWDQGSGFYVTVEMEAGYIHTGNRLLAMPPMKLVLQKESLCLMSLLIG
jgi:translation elongation factor EF-1alpha